MFHTNFTQKGEAMHKLSYLFEVPESKRCRVIVYTDCKAEADDQFALAHHLMTPKFKIVGVIAAHFDHARKMEKGKTAEASFDEINKIMALMDMEGRCPVLLGASSAMNDEQTPRPTEASRFIISEAMKDDPSPLYIACQGSLTDRASAIIEKPEICNRMTAVWIGGAPYPQGGSEANLIQDVNAANVVFSSSMPLWQIPFNMYCKTLVSLAELQMKVYPCGKIGRYLFEQMAELNRSFDANGWPYGEHWALGDQSTITVIMLAPVIGGKNINWYTRPAPRFDQQNMTYIDSPENREIRVYDYIDNRFALEDFFAKLVLNYPPRR